MKPTPTRDFKNNIFKSCNEMCKFYNIPSKVFRKRREKGWELEDALLTPIGETPASKYCTDHLGNAFKTIKDMCEHYETSPDVLYQRMRSGWTLEKALTTSINVNVSNGRKKKVVKDQFGQEFSTIQEMCEQHNRMKP